MGPVWYKQPLINIIAFVIALNMTIGVVAISARREQGSMAMAGHVRKPAAGSPAAETKNGEILAGGQVDRQRQTGAEPAGASGAQAPAGSGSSVPTGTAPGAAGTAPTAPATSNPASSRRPTTATTARRARPSTDGSTATTAPAPVAATGDQTGGPVTAAPLADEPGTTVRPGGDTAPAPTTTTTKRPAAPGPSTQSIDDAGGDTVVDGSKVARALPRADLIRSTANYTAKALLLAVKTAEAVDPRQDPRWASENTYVSWDVDTNLDGAADYIVEYFVDGGQLAADVTRADDASATSLCGVEAALSSDGYTVALDPACLGNPAAFAYRATIYYDTAPEVVTDVAPDTGFSRSVGRPKS